MNNSDNLEGKVVSWRTVHGIRSGVVVGTMRRKKDDAFLGYVVKLPNGKYSIVHPKSFNPK